MPDRPPPDPAIESFLALPARRADLGTHTLTYTRVGDGGDPLLLVHGYPETRRIWARNLKPLADAGFDVIAPDLRGFGASDPAPDGYYDPAAHAADLWALVHDVLGIDRLAVAGGDLGMPVGIELTLRHADAVHNLCVFNGVVPILPDDYEAAGIPKLPGRRLRPETDYFVAQGREPDALIAELATEGARRRYVESFYGHRMWAAPGAFDGAAVAFHVEPFLDPAVLRTSWGAYEAACGTREVSDVPRLMEKVPTPTLVLYGPADHVVPDVFVDLCRVAFPNAVGPFVVPGAGHFLQWEQADLFNRAVAAFLR